MLGDNLKEIVLRNAERFHERLLNAIRDRFAVSGPFGSWHGNADQRHGGSPCVPIVPRRHGAANHRSQTTMSFALDEKISSYGRTFWSMGRSACAIAIATAILSVSCWKGVDHGRGYRTAPDAGGNRQSDRQPVATTLSHHPRHPHIGRRRRARLLHDGLVRIFCAQGDAAHC